ncbi:PH domain-containing protein [Cetobacterium sp. SF1]|uniref:PH domain-containing protein n=1 Tax=unclassified Cetobacterium TaxID=2630983 RepID=UPI003CEEBCAD
MALKTEEISVVMWNKIEGADRHEDMLASEEIVELAYGAKRDKVIFTNKRILIINVQGLTGKKVDYHTIPYSKIASFSIETSGTFDLDCELKLWVSGLAGIEIKFLKGIDIKEVGRLLASKTM